MEYELFLLFGGALLFILDFAAVTKAEPNKKIGKAGFLATLLGFCLVVASYLIILQAFLTDNYAFSEVYSYSSTGASLFSKVYASWAGAGDSMMFLTLLLATCYFVLRAWAQFKLDKFKTSACQIFVFVLLAFIAVTALMNPFARLTSIPVDGLGLNPQLQSIWMAIHPPIVFSAYTFVVLAYVLTLASVRNGRELEASKLFTASSYFGWILLTLGIALGGAWAYQVLGWGGYWAWDPVETASLLPWLLLTAYFIVKLISKGKITLTQEFMVLTAFASLVFLSALTRGGFTQSVHSYALSAVGPVMLVFALGMVTYFLYLRKDRHAPLFKLAVDKTSLKARSFFVSFWALILIVLVCLAGLFIPNFAYSYFTFPFVLIFAVSCIGLGLDERNHYGRIIIISLIAIVIGGGIAVSGVLSNVNLLTILAAPLLVVGALLILVKSVKLINRRSWRSFGHVFLSLAIIILLLGVFFSAGAKTSVIVNGLKPNSPVNAEGLQIELYDLTLSNSSTQVFNEKTGVKIAEYSTLQAEVIVHQGRETYQGILAALFYPNYGVVIKPLIVGEVTGDVYMHFELSEAIYNSLVGTYTGNSTLPTEVSVTVQNSPMIYLVWGGVGLMILAMVVQFRNDFTLKKLPS